MTTVHPASASDLAPFRLDRFGPSVAFVKGAVDGLMAHATQIWDDDGPRPITSADRERIDAVNTEWASDGRRVLGVAMRGVDLDHVEMDDVENDLVLVGMMAMIDPPRPEVRDAVARCDSAGVRTVMITGDHPLTATAIAAELGIVGPDARAVDGVSLGRMTPDELTQTVRHTSVFARVAPEQKLDIVDALRRDGHVVSMTGDGVNDAPALRHADIGVAMGITGTDVSKEAADMVLRDDNFSTIVAAVEEGRTIDDNLRRFIAFAVAGNLGKILVMLGWPIPFLLAGDTSTTVALLPLQLLWLNLMTDGLLGLALGVEPAERGVMRRSPRTPGSSIWSDGLGGRVLASGTLIGALSLGIGFAYEAAGHSSWQSMLFMCLGVLQVFQALASRAFTGAGPLAAARQNPAMAVIVPLVVALQVIAVATPLRNVLDLERLSIVDFGVTFAAGAVVFAFVRGLGLRAARRAESAGSDVVRVAQTVER